MLCWLSWAIITSVKKQKQVLFGGNKGIYDTGWYRDNTPSFPTEAALEQPFKQRLVLRLAFAAFQSRAPAVFARG